MTLTAVTPRPHGSEWPEVMADQAGMNWMWLEEAARFATENETPWPYDLRRHIESGYFEPAPFNEILGPIRPRGEPNGLVLRSRRQSRQLGRHTAGGFHVFGREKLSEYARRHRGHGRTDSEIDEPVGRTVHDGGFDGPHNGAITWRHLLQNTSEWEGTLFGKSDVIDRNRNLAVEARAGRAIQGRCRRRGVLGIQRRPGQSAEPGAVAALSAAAARGVRGTHHAADRCVVGLVVARLSHLRCRHRRPDDRSRLGRHALGRRAGIAQDQFVGLLLGLVEVLPVGVLPAFSSVLSF